jgi:NADH dehydrogenase FAD-containing subunit
MLDLLDINVVEFSADEITEINLESKMIKTNYVSLSYDKMLLASGSLETCKILDYENVFSLRSEDDHAKIHNAALKAN